MMLLRTMRGLSMFFASKNSIRHTHCRPGAIRCLALLLVIFAGAANARGQSPQASACPVTFGFGGTRVDGYDYTGWIPVPDMDAHAGIAKLKEVVAKLGYEPGVEAYHGSEGTLAVVSKAEKNPVFYIGSNMLGPYTIHFSVDEGLGTISFQTHTPKEQNFDVVAMKAKLCSIIDVAAGYAPEKDPYAKPKFAFKNPFKKHSQAADGDGDVAHSMVGYTDWLFQHAMSSGRSIVIMPIVNAGYKHGQALTSPAYLSDASSTIIWQDVKDPSKIFKVGAGESNLNTGMRGYQIDVTTGKQDYLVYIVEPGTYSVTGDTYDARRTHISTISDGPARHVSRLGQTNLLELKYAEFETKLAWHDATYADRTVHETYCTLEIVGGPCVASQSSSYKVRDQTSAAGYRNDTFRNDVDGVSVATKISKEFASFTVAPGEVVAVDGFYADPSAGNFTPTTCSRVGSQQVQCQLGAYSLIHLPTYIDEVKHTIHPDSTRLPNMAQIFSRTVYRPLKISAKPVAGSESGWGKTYKLKQ